MLTVEIERQELLTTIYVGVSLFSGCHKILPERFSSSGPEGTVPFDRLDLSIGSPAPFEYEVTSHWPDSWKTTSGLTTGFTLNWDKKRGELPTAIEITGKKINDQSGNITGDIEGVTGSPIEASGESHEVTKLADLRSGPLGHLSESVETIE